MATQSLREKSAIISKLSALEQYAPKKDTNVFETVKPKVIETVEKLKSLSAASNSNKKSKPVDDYGVKQDATSKKIERRNHSGSVSTGRRRKVIYYEDYRRNGVANDAGLPALPSKASAIISRERSSSRADFKFSDTGSASKRPSDLEDPVTEATFDDSRYFELSETASVGDRPAKTKVGSSPQSQSIASPRKDPEQGTNASAQESAEGKASHTSAKALPPHLAVLQNRPRATHETKTSSALAMSKSPKRFVFVDKASDLRAYDGKCWARKDSENDKSVNIGDSASSKGKGAQEGSGDKRNSQSKGDSASSSCGFKDGKDDSELAATRKDEISDRKPSENKSSQKTTCSFLPPSNPWSRGHPLPKDVNAQQRTALEAQNPNRLIGANSRPESHMNAMGKTKNSELEEVIKAMLPPALRHVPKPIFLSQRRREAEAQKKTKRVDIKNPPNALIQNVASVVPSAKNETTRQADIESSDMKGSQTNKKPRRQIFEKVFLDFPVEELIQELGSKEKQPPKLFRPDPSWVGSENLRRVSEISANLGRDAVENIYIWRDFIKPTERPDSVEPAVEPQSKVNGEFAGFEGDFKIEPEWEIREQYDFSGDDHERRIHDWIKACQTDARIKPVKVDVTRDEFINGVFPISGLRRPQAALPPEECMNRERIKLQLGAINWNAIEVLPPDDPWSLTPEHRNQTANQMIERRMEASRAEEQRKRKEIEEYERVRKLDEMQPKERDRKRRNHDANVAWRYKNPFTPKADVYIRPAKESDMGVIADLYNHYVRNTVQAVEMDNVSEAEWRARFRTAETQRKPFLVAILKFSKDKIPTEDEKFIGRGANHRFIGKNEKFERQKARRNERAPPVKEKLVGFTYAAPFGSHESSMRQTHELFVFVNHDYYRLGIGKNLLDRALPCLDFKYYTSSGTDLILPNPNWRRDYELGGNANCKKIVMSIFFRTSDEEEFVWKKKALEKFGFLQASFFHHVAEKFEKPYHVAHFTKETSDCGHNISMHYPGFPTRFPNLINMPAGKELSTPQMYD